MNTATAQILGYVLLLVGTLAVGWFTRGSAKDTLGVTLITQVLDEQRENITSLKEDVAALKSESRATRRNIAAHRPWDNRIYDQARQAGWDVPPPPPLEHEEHVT